MTMSGAEQENMNPGLTMVEMVPSWAAEVNAVNQQKIKALSGWLELLNSEAVTGRAPFADPNQSKVQNG